MPDAEGRGRRFPFPARCRLRRSRDFDRTLREGLRVGDVHLTLWAVPNELGFTRFGLIVGRKHGNAVRRNRFKRLLREAFRLARSRLPVGLDLVCAPRTGVDVALHPVIDSLTTLAARAARRLKARETKQKDSGETAGK